MLRYLLDTNIVIYVIKRKPLSALKLFKRVEALQFGNWAV